MSGKVNPVDLYRVSKRIGPPCRSDDFCILCCSQSIWLKTDELEAYIRENVGFEVVEGSLERLHAELLERLKRVDCFKELRAVYKTYGEKSGGRDKQTGRLS